MSLAIVGCGAMGEALLAGWLASSWSASQIRVVEAATERASYLERTYHVRCVAMEEAAAADIVVLVVKPHHLGGVLTELAESLDPHTLVVSMAAGFSLDALAAGLPGGQPLIRVMPNTPALVGQGMAGITPGPHASPAHVDAVTSLMDAVGKSIVVAEESLHTVTGLSGSGPAYVFLLAEAMIDAGVEHGLPRAQATVLVNQTLTGAAAMLQESGRDATSLKQSVTSPGGTTAAGLREMEQRGIRAAMMATVEATITRSRQLSG